MGSNPIRATNLTHFNVRSIHRLRAVFHFGAFTTRLLHGALRYPYIHLLPNTMEGPQYVLRVQGLTYVDAKDGDACRCAATLAYCEKPQDRENGNNHAGRREVDGTLCETGNSVIARLCQTIAP